MSVEIFTKVRLRCDFCGNWGSFDGKGLQDAYRNAIAAAWIIEAKTVKGVRRCYCEEECVPPTRRSVKRIGAE